MWFIIVHGGGECVWIETYLAWKVYFGGKLTDKWMRYWKLFFIQICTEKPNWKQRSSYECFTAFF